MYKAVKLFKDLKRPGSLKEIIIVVYPETDITVKQMFLAHRQTHKLKTLHVRSLAQMREVYKNGEGQDIEKYPDTNPQLKPLDPSKEEWKCTSYVGELDDQDKCAEDSVNLKPRTLIHCYSKDNTERQITDGIIRGLKKAVDLKCNTVTIPIVSGGHLAKKPKNAAQMIINAVTKAKSNIYVVTVVIDDSTTFEPFADKVDAVFKGKLHAPADTDKSSVADEIWKETHAEKASESLSGLQAVMTMTNLDSVLVITSNSDETNKMATEEFTKRLHQKLPDVLKVEQNVF